MSKTQEALKMAIEAMECAEEVDWELNSLHVLNILQANKACKEALAYMQEHDNEVIERCAKHIEEVTLVDVWADEIRALKGKS